MLTLSLTWIGHKPPWPALGSVIELPTSSESDETFEFAARCLKECQSNSRHRLCTSQRRQFRPTRLLQISQPRKPIKLQEKGLTSSFVDYIALSHCWGVNVPTVTTTKNRKQRLKAIEWDELPPLFQDLITITYHLGIKYIWIDALCIVQDDKSDWEHESSQMASVYAEAYVTIAAVRAMDSSERFLGPRKRSAKVRYHNTKGDRHLVKVRQISDHYPSIMSSVPAHIEGPLTERAWALQEHVLCSRVLHYTETELIFECREMFSCECTPRFKQTSLTTPGLLPNISQALEKRKPYFAWKQLVEKYTLRKLTRASDKLPAISGMALKIQEIVNSEYLGGLWRANLAEDLLWSSAPDLKNPAFMPALRDYRAPSWSWASVDTQIRFEDCSRPTEIQALISCISTKMDLASKEFPLGEVRSGSITIQGPTLEGCLIAPERLEFYYKLRFDKPALVDVFPDSLLVMESTIHRARRARPRELYSPFKAPVTCLGVIERPGEGVTIGLVLSQREDDAFERIGTFSCGRENFVKAQKQTLLLV
jgi:heterokaryon incompatibility protein (HET)